MLDRSRAYAIDLPHAHHTFQTERSEKEVWERLVFVTYFQAFSPFSAKYTHKVRFGCFRHHLMEEAVCNLLRSSPVKTALDQL